MKMPEENPTSELTVIHIGEEWSGKSSAGNTIMDQHVFEVDRDTEHASQSSGIIEGRNVTVVDTPGWDSECSPDVPLKILKQAYTATSVTCQGFHVLLLTISISQSQKWNQKVAQRLWNAVKLFNDDVWKHTMLLFTRADHLTSSTFEGFLKGCLQPFHSLIEKCKSRYHFLGNHGKNDRSQIRELLEKVEQMVRENDGHWLQLITNEMKETERETDTLVYDEQFETKCFKMEEQKEESWFWIEDYMFQSLRPRGSVPPKTETVHTVGVCSIQDEDTEPAADIYSESPNEINRALVMGSDDWDTEANDGDGHNAMTPCKEVELPGMDRVGDKDVDLQNLTLEWNALYLIITCLDSNQQQTGRICVLQISVCWRTLKPPCPRDWMSFTVVLYQFGGCVGLVFNTDEVPKETGDQTMNAFVPAFVKCHQWSSNEIHEMFPLLLGQNDENWTKRLDKDTTKCGKIEDEEEIHEYSTGGKDEDLKQCDDEVLPEHFQKGEEALKEENVEKSQERKKSKDEVLPQNLRKVEEQGNKVQPQLLQRNKEHDGLPQNVYQHDYKEQHGYDHNIDEMLLQHSGEGEEFPQHVRKGGEQYEEKPRHAGEDEDEELPQHFHQGEEGNYNEQLQHDEEGEEFLQNIRQGDANDNEQLQHHHEDGHHELLQHIRQEEEGNNNEQLQKGHKYDEDDELLQHIRQGDANDNEQLQHRHKDEELLQNLHHGEEDAELLQHAQKGKDEELLQNIHQGDANDNEQLQHSHEDEENEELLQHIRQEEEGNNNEQLQHGQKDDEDEEDEELLQHIHQGNDNEQLQHRHEDEEDEELLQHICQGDANDNEQLQHGQKGEEDEDEELLQHIRQEEEGNNNEQLQHGQEDDDEEDEELVQHIRQGDANDNEQLQHSHEDEEDEELLQHIHQGEEDAELLQHAQKGKDEELQSIHEYNNENEELPHHGQALPQYSDKLNIEERSEQIKHTNYVKRMDDDKSWGGAWGQPGDINNSADNEDEEDKTKRTQHLGRREPCPGLSVKLNHDDVRKTEMDTKRLEFMRGRTCVRNAGDEHIRREHRGIRRTKSLDRFIGFKREDKTRQPGGIWKLRRARSLDRYETFNNEQGKRLRSLRANTERMRRSFFLEAIRALHQNPTT